MSVVLCQDCVHRIPSQLGEPFLDRCALVPMEPRPQPYTCPVTGRSGEITAEQPGKAVCVCKNVHLDCPDFQSP